VIPEGEAKPIENLFRKLIVFIFSLKAFSPAVRLWNYLPVIPEGEAKPIESPFRKLNVFIFSLKAFSPAVRLWNYLPVIPEGEAKPIESPFRKLNIFLFNPKTLSPAVKVLGLNKKTSLSRGFQLVAEREGFEPSVPFRGTHAFQVS